MCFVAVLPPTVPEKSVWTGWRAAFFLLVIVAFHVRGASQDAVTTPAPAGDLAAEVQCEGEYGAHLQGVATNHKDALFWSFTLSLVKTDLQGKVLAKANSIYHLGDLTCVDGKVYAAACTSWDRPSNNSKVYVYNADDLKLIETKPVPDVTYGAGGIEYHDGKFYIVGGADPKAEDNQVYVYDRNFNHLDTRSIPTGHTELGVQAICRHGGAFWLACYGNILAKLDDDLKLAGRYSADCGYGLKSWRGDAVIVGQTPFREEGKSKRWRGVVRLAVLDAQGGLVFKEPAKP